MAISFIANALGATNSTTSFSITLPTTAANDILILEFTHRGTGNGTIGGTSVTTGGLTWTLKHSQLYATSAFSGKTYWTRATGNHATQTVTGSSLTNSCAAILTQYRGCATSGDPLADATIVGEQNASTNETQAEITTATNGAWVVLVVANSPDVAVATQACTSPGTLTERAERLSTGGTDTSISHASAAKATAGATGAFTWTQTDGAGGSWAYALVPLSTVDVTVNATGTSSTGSVGTVTATGTANVSTSVTGTAATGSTGTVSLTGSASISPTGTAGTGAVGTVTATGTSPDVTVDVTGVDSTGFVGDITAVIDALASLTGASGTSAAGSVTVTGDCLVSLTGVFANGLVGDESVGGPPDEGGEDEHAPTTPYCWAANRGARGRR